MKCGRERAPQRPPPCCAPGRYQDEHQFIALIVYWLGGRSVGLPYLPKSIISLLLSEHLCHHVPIYRFIWLYRNFKLATFNILFIIPSSDSFLRHNIHILFTYNCEIMTDLLTNQQADILIHRDVTLSMIQIMLTTRRLCRQFSRCPDWLIELLIKTSIHR